MKSEKRIWEEISIHKLCLKMDNLHLLDQILPDFQNNFKFCERSVYKIKFLICIF